MDKDYIIKTKKIEFIDTGSVNLYYFYVNKDNSDIYDDEIDYIFKSLSLIGLNELKKKSYEPFLNKWGKYIELQTYTYSYDAILWVDMPKLDSYDKIGELHKDISKLYVSNNPLTKRNSLYKNIVKCLKAKEFCVVLNKGKIVFCIGQDLVEKNDINILDDLGIKEDLLKSQVAFAEYGYFNIGAKDGYCKVLVKYLHLNEIKEEYRWYERYDK